MTTFNKKTTSTYDLSSLNTTFGANASVNVSGGNGVLGDSGSDWSITNLGSITGGAAIDLLGDGSVTNAGKLANSSDVGTVVDIAGSGTVKNSGTITGVYNSTTGRTSSIDLVGGGTIKNLAGGVINGDVVGGSSGVTGSTTAITNAGTIKTIGKGTSGSRFGAVNLDNGGSVANSGTISFSGSYGRGIFLQEGGKATNTGVIKFTATTNAYMDGIKLENGAYGSNGAAGVINMAGEHLVGVALDTGKFTNAGLIEDVSAASVHVVGMEIEGAAGYAKNSGTLTFKVANHVTAIYLDSGSSDASAVNSGAIGVTAGYNATGMLAEVAGTVTNSGRISIIVQHNGAGLELEDGGTAINTGTIGVNAGTTGASAGVFLKDGGAFTNSGSVSDKSAHSSGVIMANGGTLTNNAKGAIVDTKGYGVYVYGSSNASITNAGSISGANAVVFKDAGTIDDEITNTLTLETGSQLIGAAIGSVGADLTNALVLEGHGTAANSFENFQTITVANNASWTLSGPTLSGALTIGDDALVILRTAYSEDVSFTASGELELSKPYTGALTLGGADKIDLLDFKYVKGDTASIAGSVLTIDTKASATVVSLNLNASGYDGSDFSLSADAGGHLLISYKP